VACSTDLFCTEARSNLVTQELDHSLISYDVETDRLLVPVELAQICFLLFGDNKGAKLEDYSPVSL
jgi:hypothetical protein